MSLELVGWLGSICFAICGIPQAYKSFKEGHSHGISWGFLTLWGSGELMTLTYIIPKMDMPLIFNYIGNIIFIAIIAKYKMFPREKE